VKITTEQTANGFRRRLNRTRIDRQRRTAIKNGVRMRAAMSVLREVRRGEHADAKAISFARIELDAPWQRVSKWSNRVARWEAREGKHDEKIAAAIAKARKKAADEVSAMMAEA
jgi:intergrase/recombinase